MSIEWEEQRPARVCLLVGDSPVPSGEGGEYDECLREATLDDLRKACEAVGLVVLTREENEVQDRKVRTSIAAVDMANKHADEAEAARDAAIARAEKAEAECAKLRERAGTAELDAEGFAHDRDEARARVAELEARLAALTAPVDGEPSDAEIERAYYNIPPEVIQSKGYATARRALYHLGVQHERARHTRDIPRATSREVEAMADEAYRARTGMYPTMGDMRALAANVADRVRREQCLVTRAVEMGEGLNVVPGSKGRWYVTVKMVERNCAPSDVARVLGEMLGGG